VGHLALLGSHRDHVCCSRIAGGVPVINIVWAVVFVLVAPVFGALVAGIDRKITAHMQGRVGPSIFQPFYDVGKLFEKEQAVVNETQGFYAICYLIFMIFTGALFFAGGDLLLVIFALTLAQIFLVLGAFSANSPYSYVGAERELLQILAYEPMVILTAVGMFMVTKSFNVSDIVASTTPVILLIPGIFLGFLYVLTIKLRKSPFDISTSHHAHQEIVKGVTTEFSGPSLGFIEITHWYETVFLLGFVYLFFGFSPLIAVVAVIVVYLLEILVDNTNARVKWQLAVKSSWLIAAVVGVLNLAALYYVSGVIP
jgi:formate hydrogenlyase subunit 4